MVKLEIVDVVEITFKAAEVIKGDISVWVKDVERQLKSISGFIGIKEIHITVGERPKIVCLVEIDHKTQTRRDNVHVEW